jgi:small subunit ribosomal protein S8
VGVITDPIADMLTRFATRTANHPLVDIPASKMKIAVAAILAEEGFIRNFERVEEGRKAPYASRSSTAPKRKSHHRTAAHQPPGSARLYRARRDPEGSRWSRARHHVDEQRDHVGQTR